MSTSKNVAAVVEIIEKAAKKKSWSYAKLTKHINKGENTLHRWRSGKIASFNIDALVLLFEMAGESMDQTFGLEPPAAAIGPGEGQMSEAQLRDQFEVINRRLDELDSVKRTLQAFSLVLGQTDPQYTDEERELRGIRANIPSGEAFRSAVGKVKQLGQQKTKQSTEGKDKAQPA